MAGEKNGKHFKDDAVEIEMGEDQGEFEPCPEPQPLLDGQKQWPSCVKKGRRSILAPYE